MGGNAIIAGVIGDDAASKTMLKILNQKKINTDGILNVEIGRASCRERV